MTNLRTNFTNLCETTTSTSISTGDTVIPVNDTSEFPAVPFYALIADDPDDASTHEIVLVDGSVGSTQLNLTTSANRGLGGNGAMAHDGASIVAVVPTANALNDMHDRISTHAHTGATDDGVQIATSDLTGHTKAAHDALGIATSSLSGHDASAHESFRLVGEVVPYAGSSAPSLWLLCRGQAVSRTTYADLFSTIGTTFGTGDGSTTFNVPDLQAKFPVGVSTSDADHDLGDTGGEQEHTLTTAEMPSHTHTGPSHSHGDGTLAASSGGSHTHDTEARENSSNGDHVHNSPASSGGVQFSTSPNGVDTTYTVSVDSGGAHTHNVTGTTAASGTGATGSAGSGDAHENRPPFLSLNFIVFAGA